MHAAISRRCYFSLATKTPRHSQPGGLAAKKAMRSFARGLTMLDQAGAKVVAFDFLFTEPDEPVPAELREAAGAAAEALAGERSLPKAVATTASPQRYKLPAMFYCRSAFRLSTPPGRSPPGSLNRPTRGSRRASSRRFSRCVPSRRFCRSKPWRRCRWARPCHDRLRSRWCTALRLHCAAVRGGFPALTGDTRDRRLSRRRLAAGRARARRRPSHWRPRGTDRPGDALVD